MTSPDRRHRVVPALAMTLLIGYTLVNAGPVVGPTTAIDPSVGASAGSAATSSSHRIDFTVGENAIGTILSPSHELATGMQVAVARPGRVTSLAATTGPQDNSITLTWTAPGADGTVGIASRYDIRYTTSVATAPHLSEIFFSQAASITPFAAIPAPASHGTEQAVILTGLQTGVAYYFALKAVDTGDSWGFVSAGASAVAQLVPPAAVTDLVAVPGTLGRQLALTWTAPGNDGTIGAITGGAFRIRCSSWTDGTSSFWDAGSWHAYPDHFEVVIATSAVPGTVHTFLLTGLRDGIPYFVTLRTRDQHADNWSALSNVATGYAELPIVSVTVSTGAYDFGHLPLGVSTITPGIQVTNAGNVRQTWSLRCTTATTGIPWMAAGTPGMDAFVLQAAFHAMQPTDASFGPEDIVWSTAAVTATAAVYSIDGSQTGQDVPPGASRTWWLRLMTPLDTSTTVQQRIRTWVIAEEAP